MCDKMLPNAGEVDNVHKNVLLGANSANHSRDFGLTIKDILMKYCILPATQSLQNA